MYKDWPALATALSDPLKQLRGATPDDYYGHSFLRLRCRDFAPLMTCTLGDTWELAAAPGPDDALYAFSSLELLVLAALQASAAGDGEARARDLSELSARTGLSAAACAAAVIELELRGECSRLPGGRYIGRAPLY